MKSSTAVIHFETHRDNKTRWVKQAQLEGSNLVDWITGALNQRCYDYNTRAMRNRKERLAGPASGRARQWLKIMAMIDRDRVNSTEICKVLAISRNSLTRYLADMEDIYGVVTEYVRPDGQKPGWYEITDWGVLDELRVREKYADQATRP